MIFYKNLAVKRYSWVSSFTQWQHLLKSIGVIYLSNCQKEL